MAAITEMEDMPAAIKGVDNEFEKAQQHRRSMNYEVFNMMLYDSN